MNDPFVTDAGSPEPIRCPLPKYYTSPLTMRTECVWVDCGRSYCEKCRSKDKLNWLKEMSQVIETQPLYCVKMSDVQLNELGEFLGKDEKTSYPVEGGRMVFMQADPKEYGFEQAEVVDHAFLEANAEEIFKTNDFIKPDTRRSSGKLLKNLAAQTAPVVVDSTIEVVEVTCFETHAEEEKVMELIALNEQGCGDLCPQTWEEAKVMAEIKTTRLIALFHFAEINVRKGTMKLKFDSKKFKPYRNMNPYGLNSGDRPPLHEQEFDAVIFPV